MCIGLQRSSIKVVHDTSRASVVLKVIRTEGHNRLQVCQQLLGETVQDSSIVEGGQLGDVVLYVCVLCHSVMLHVLVCTQTVNDVNTKLVDGQITVFCLVVKDMIRVYKAIGGGLCRVVKQPT
jgi:hypothetical protein